MAKSRIAPQRQILAMYTAVMRGEITDWAIRKADGTQQLVPVPPKVSDRMHAAELLYRRMEALQPQSQEAAQAVRQILQSLEGSA